MQPNDKLKAWKGEPAKERLLGCVVMLHHHNFLTDRERNKVMEINPASGAKFDPHQHESISHQPSAEVPEEHVLQVVRVGYTLHGRLLRPASVVLSSGPAKKEAS